MAEDLEFTDKSLTEDINFFVFLPPSCERSNGTVTEQEYLDAIDQDLHYLLLFTHKRFWAQAIHDKSLCNLLDSYLQNAPRPYEAMWDISLEAKVCLRNVHKRIFLTMLRLSTHQETQDFPSSVFASLIYNHSLFTISRILDLCALYGDSNCAILGKMIANVFNKQPRYWDHLKDTMSNIEEVLNSFTANCKPQNETMMLDAISNSIKPVEEVLQLVNQFMDIVYTLRSLLSVFPSSSRSFWEANLPEKLVKFFEDNVPILKSYCKECSKEDCQVSSLMKKHLSQAINESCFLIRLLISSNQVDEGGVADSSPSLESLVMFFGCLTSSKIFLKEFGRHCNLREVLEDIKSSNPSLDQAQVDYLLSAIGEVDPEQEDVEVKRKPLPSKGGRAKDNSTAHKIQQVQEILPDLEPGFIEDCLKEFNGNHETFIQRYLEGQLPPHLMAIADSPPQPLEHPTSSVANGNRTHLPKAELVDSRVGHYDFDEFDLMHNPNVDWSRIHKGKKHQSAHSILSDRSHIPLMKGRGLDLLEFDEYDDEYDDTYDSQTVGAIDQDSADELPAIQRLNEKGKYSTKQNWYDEMDNDSIGAPVPDLETHRPVVTILKRPDQSTQTSKNQDKAGQKKSRGTGPGGRVDVRIDEHKLSKSERKDVLEEEDKKKRKQDKGGGDDGGKTQVYRQHKERNKGSRANHNRKMAADKKRKAF